MDRHLTHCYPDCLNFLSLERTFLVVNIILIIMCRKLKFYEINYETASKITHGFRDKSTH